MARDCQRVPRFEHAVDQVGAAKLAKDADQDRHIHYFQAPSPSLLHAHPAGHSQDVLEGEAEKLGRAP